MTLECNVLANEVDKQGCERAEAATGTWREMIRDNSESHQFKATLFPLFLSQEVIRQCQLGEVLSQHSLGLTSVLASSVGIREDPSGLQTIGADMWQSPR